MKGLFLLLCLGLALGTSGCAGVSSSNGGNLPPALTIANVTATNISSTATKITWTTNEPATSQVEYGTATSYGQSSPLDTTLVTGHSVAISGLTASTTYHYRVKPRDSAGNLAVSGDSTFKTLSQGPGIPPTLGWWQIPNTKLQSVCPPNTPQYDFSFECQYVIKAWNGGIGDRARSRMIIWGGGHGDYYGNEIYSLNLNDLTLTRLNNPSPINALSSNNCPEALSDGNPNSRHTYGGLAYIAHADRMFVFGGSLACGPGNTGNGTWTLDLATLQWKRMDPHNGPTPDGTNLSVISDYDPNTKKVHLHDGFRFFQYEYETNTYKLLAATAQTPFYSNAVIDPKRKLFIIIGPTYGGAPRMHAISIAPRSNYDMQNWTSLQTGCDGLMNADYPGLAYDLVQDRIVGWGNEGDTNTVYVFNLDTKSCTTQTFSGGPPLKPGTRGTFGRWQYFPSLGVFAVVNDWAINAFTLRLTSPPQSPHGHR